MFASILMLRSGFHTALAVYQRERSHVDAHGIADWIPTGVFHAERDYDLQGIVSEASGSLKTTLARRAA